MVRKRHESKQVDVCQVNDCMTSIRECAYSLCLSLSRYPFFQPQVFAESSVTICWNINQSNFSLIVVQKVATAVFSLKLPFFTVAQKSWQILGPDLCENQQPRSSKKRNLVTLLPTTQVVIGRKTMNWTISTYPLDYIIEF